MRAGNVVGGVWVNCSMIVQMYMSAIYAHHVCAAVTMDNYLMGKPVSPETQSSSRRPGPGNI